MRNGLGAVAVVLLLSAMPLAFVGSAVASAAPAEAKPLAMFHSGPLASTINSTNWAGYAVTGASGSVKFVNGSWIEPKVTCPSTSSTVYLDAFWVGIDGYGSTTVEQTGTLAECIGGVVVYYAWYEFYPNPLTLYSFTVSPGDTFHASVTFLNSTVGFRTVIKDVTTGHGASTTQTVSGAQRVSAEWIAEAPSSGTSLYALGNFGTVKFGTDATGQGLTNDATVHGVTKAIGKFASSSVTRIDMITTSGTLLKAVTSKLSPDGTSFNVTWKRAGP